MTVKKILLLDIDYTLNLEDPRPMVAQAEKRGLAKYGKAIWKLFKGPAEDMSILPHPIPYKHYDTFTYSYDKVIIITSRLEDWRKPTTKWLRKWDFTWDHMYMRPSGTFTTSSREIKQNFIDKIQAKWPEATVTAIDDDENVVDLYRDEGFKVFVAPDEWSKALTYHRGLNTRTNQSLKRQATTKRWLNGIKE